jgi:hypothetical protein
VTIVFPEATKAQGNTSVAVVQTIAIPGAPDLSSEIQAASTVIASCYLYSGGVGTTSTTKGEAPRRVCTTNSYQQFGNTTYEVSDLQYVYSPQGADAEADAMRDALTEGSEVFLVVRRGLPAETTAFAAGQKVDVWKVRLGPQNKTQTGDGEYDEYSITQSVIVIDDPVEDVAIVA